MLEIKDRLTKGCLTCWILFVGEYIFECEVSEKGAGCHFSPDSAWLSSTQRTKRDEIVPSYVN